MTPDRQSHNGHSGEERREFKVKYQHPKATGNNLNPGERCPQEGKPIIQNRIQGITYESVQHCYTCGIVLEYKGLIR